MTDFGAFIDLSNGLEGLLHISEVSKEKIKKLESVISIGQELDVKIVKIEPEARKIGLSLKGIEGAPAPVESKVNDEPAAEVEVTENAALESADAGAPVEEVAAEEKTEKVKEEENV